jgi:hypothetical protein
LLKFNGNGDTVWSRLYLLYDYNDFGYGVQQTSDSGYIITGYTSDDSSVDLWLIKTDSLGFANVTEPETPPVTHLDWQIPVSVGRQITLHYTNHPQGFHASIFDVTGRKVDELHAVGQSGTLTWGESYGAGVYFVVPDDSVMQQSYKVVLVR